jgi:uncharacterized membrane protein
MSHALGVFSATFLYALTLLAWVDRSASGKVPLISGWMVFILLLASMGMFIALIDRIGALRITRMLAFIGDKGREAIDELYPSTELDAGDLETAESRGTNAVWTLRYAGSPQVIQAINAVRLMSLARQWNAVIEVTAAVGDTVLEMTPLMRVYGSRQGLDEQALTGAIEIGDERTFEQDPKYAIRLMVDIAIKALSPAINDPTTAVQALDQIEDLLLRLGRRRLEIGSYNDERGVLRLLLHFPTWEDFLRLALDEIRFCGANSVQVMRRMKALIKNLMTVLPAQRQAALRYWERRLQDTIGRTFTDAEEKQDASVADRQGLGIGDESRTSSDLHVLNQ